jgi:hypothetical protein
VLLPLVVLLLLPLLLLELRVALAAGLALPGCQIYYIDHTGCHQLVI